MYAASLKLEASGSELRANGKPFMVKGLTWWGAESTSAVPEGLLKASIDDLVGFTSRNGFNALRLPFLHQRVLFNAPIPWGSFSAKLNPYLVDADGEPVTYIDMLQVIAKRAATKGLLVWLVAHSYERLWYSRSIAESTILESWSSLANHLCGQWNIAAVDLKNKPSGATWGFGSSTDWDAAATRLGEHVLRKCPRWLISVEGVGQHPGARQDSESEFAALYPSFFDGENLVGADLHPVVLSDPTKVVYSPHVYGPSAADFPYIEEEDYPESLEQVWDEHFLFLLHPSRKRKFGSPVIINVGVGGSYSARDLTFLQWVVRLCTRRGLSVFYNSLNPLPGKAGDAPDYNSPPLSTNVSGGLLLPDWSTPQNTLLQMISHLPATRVSSLFAPEASPPPPAAKRPTRTVAAPPPVPPAKVVVRHPPPPPPPTCGPTCLAIPLLLAWLCIMGVVLKARKQRERAEAERRRRMALAARRPPSDAGSDSSHGPRRAVPAGKKKKAAKQPKKRGGLWSGGGSRTSRFEEQLESQPLAPGEDDHREGSEPTSTPTPPPEPQSPASSDTSAAPSATAAEKRRKRGKKAGSRAAAPPARMVDSESSEPEPEPEPESESSEPEPQPEARKKGKKKASAPAASDADSEAAPASQTAPKSRRKASAPSARGDAGSGVAPVRAARTAKKKASTRAAADSDSESDEPVRPTRLTADVSSKARRGNLFVEEMEEEERRIARRRQEEMVESAMYGPTKKEKKAKKSRKP